MVKLIKVAESGGGQSANILLFHGLGGDLRGTWRIGVDEQLFWPRWLAKDIEGLVIWSVGYDAPVSRWRGSAMHLSDRATNIFARILAETEFQSAPLVLIGYSFGGLLIKQILRTAASEASRRSDAANLVERVQRGCFHGNASCGCGPCELG